MNPVARQTVFHCLFSPSTWVLRPLIRALDLKKHDPLIEAKLDLARALPFTDTPEEQQDLRRGLGL